MNTTTEKEIDKLKRKIAALEAKAIKADAKRKKTALHKIMAIVTKYGFATLAELTADAKNIVSKRAEAPRKRAKITEEIRKAVLEDLKKGADSAQAIAKRHGLSQPSVNNIKKAAGLTKSRKMKAARKPVMKRSPKKVLKPKKAPKAAAPAAPVEAPAAAAAV
jgi:histone H1/5